MINEEQVIENIINNYNQNLIGIDFETQISRDKPICEFTPAQLHLFEHLVDNKEILFLEIELFNDDSHNLVKLDDEINKNHLYQYQLYHIQRINFNFAYAMIWISLIFKDEIDQLMDEVLKPDPIDRKNILLAIIVALVCFTTLLITFGVLPEIMVFILFAGGFLSLGYIYDKIKELITYKSKKKQSERKFYVSQYLTEHLANYADDKLRLDHNFH